jgi:hypothetical protein
MFTILNYKVEYFNKIIIKDSIFSVDYRLIALDPHYLIIVRDKEGEDFLVKLLFTLYKSKEFNNRSFYSLCCNFSSKKARAATQRA